MRLIAAVWLVSTVGWCQLPKENVRFVLIKKQKMGVSSGYKKMAIGYEVLYGITDKAQVNDAYEAGIFFQKGAKQAKAGRYLFPKFEKQKLKEDDLERDEFMDGLINANNELRRLLENTEPGEIRRKVLMSLYVQFPYHTPTILAAARNERHLGQSFVADQLVRYVDKLETSPAFWPLLIAKAEMARDGGYLENAIDILLEAEKLYFSSNPSSELIRTWTSERNDANGKPEALAELGDIEGLKALGKKNHEALFQIGRVYEKRGLKINAKDAYMDAFKYGEDRAYHALTAARKVVINVSELDGMARTAKKLADEGVEDPHILTMAAFDQKYDQAERIEKLESVVSRYPDFDEAQSKLLAAYRSSNQVVQLTQLCKTMIERNPSQENVQIAIRYLVNQGSLQEAVTVYKKFLGNYRHEPHYLGVGRMLHQNGSASIDPELSQRLAYELIREGLACAKRFDFERGAAFTDQAKELWPEQPDLALLTANILKNGGKSAQALPHYEESVERHPDSAPLFELLGDCYYASDQLNNAIEAYESSQSLDPSRALLPFKIKDAKKQRNKKVGATVVAVLSVVGGGASMSSGNISFSFRVPINAGRTSATTFGMGDQGQDGPASGYGVEETAPLLKDLFSAYLDLEEKYAIP